MGKRRSLNDVLHIGEIDEDELSIILSSQLPRGAQFLANEVEYRTSNDDLAITVVYREGRIESAYAGAASTASLEETLEAAIRREVIEPATKKVSRQLMFCGRPVEGWWQYANEVRIGPAPVEAPRPGVMMGDHPFVLDLAFVDSPNWQIRRLRSSRRAYELALLLDLLLVPRISAIGSRVRHRWVIPLATLGDAGSVPSPVWSQEGYFVPDFVDLVDGLPAYAGEVGEIRSVESARYYDPSDLDTRSDVLSVPSDLGSLVARFEALSRETRLRFLRACYWHHLAGTIWTQSQSLHLAALVNAIECLATEGPERSLPDGPTKLFRSFLTTYAPGAPSGRRVERLYETRSNITHGERLLDYDQPPGAAMLSQRSTADRQVGDDAVLLCRGALINWLWAESHERASPLLTQGVKRLRSPRPGTKSEIKIITFEESV